MEQYDLAALIREEFGKGPAGRLRRNGQLPANLYGPNIEKNVPITLKSREVERALHGHAGGNVLIKLDVKGFGKKTVMFKELQTKQIKAAAEGVDGLTPEMRKFIDEAKAAGVTRCPIRDIEAAAEKCPVDFKTATPAEAKAAIEAVMNDRKAGANRDQQDEA